MNGGLLWVLIAAPAALLAAWLYLNTFEVQHDDYKVQQAQVQSDKAKFDAEFAAALGKPDPELDKQAQAAARNLAQAKAEVTSKEEKRRQEMDKMKHDLDQFLTTEGEMKK
jgi:hypothetical protein